MYTVNITQLQKYLTIVKKLGGINTFKKTFNLSAYNLPKFSDNLSDQNLKLWLFHKSFSTTFQVIDN